MSEINRLAGNNGLYRIKVNQIVTPDEVLDQHFLTISGDTIQELRPYDRKIQADASLDQYIMYPAFINAHDHL